VLTTKGPTVRSRGCKRKFRLLLAGAGFLAFLPLPVWAQRLPIEIYTPAEGLPHPTINRVVWDSQGFLWVCTPEGLSRFDGYSFTNYTTRDGLPSDSIWDLLQTRSGEYWVATSNGLSRFDPKPSRHGDPMFVTYRAQTGQTDELVYVLKEGRDGTIWCGTDAGLLRLHRTGSAWKFDVIELGNERARGGMSVESLLEDRTGALWAGGVAGLYRLTPEGSIECYYRGPLAKTGSPMEFAALLEDQRGRIWAGGMDGLYQLLPPPRPTGSWVARVYKSREGLPRSVINALLQSSKGRFWIATDDGIAELLSKGAEGHTKFRNYGMSNGLVNAEIETLAEDGEGNLWLGSHGGLMRLAGNGFTSYGRPDGLTGETGPASIFEDQAGNLCVIPGHRSRSIARFNGRRFITIVPGVPKRIVRFGWGWNQIHLQDHLGDWWIPTGGGLCRFPRVKDVKDLAHIPPKAIYTAHDGLPWNNIFRVYEDSRGDVWISTVGTGKNGLTRWDRRTRIFQNYLDKHWLMDSGAPSAFAEDGAGDLWIGFYRRNLVRYRHGQFDFFTATSGIPDGSIQALHVDRIGRLWIASGGGLGRVDDPATDHPHFALYTTALGLSSSQVTCLAEDRYGRIYVGSGRGIDRIGPNLTQVLHYSNSDGLPSGLALTAFRDHRGTLWFGGELGLVRFDPESPSETLPPPIRISRVAVRGLPQPLSELGETTISGLDLGPDQDQIQIDFASLKFGVGDVIKYQYRLEGADKNWSELTEMRSVSYARLSPGRYQFLVRAVNSEGSASVEPAVLSFRIIPPVWQRWWFLTLGSLLIAAIIYSAVRVRLERLLELERVRTRIATDLHDDIGSSLTQIAIISEVAQKGLSANDPQLVAALGKIANISRQLVDSMSDIVWAINPRRDHLGDLAQRMRRFASDVLTAYNIDVAFHQPPERADASLHSDVRREVLLVFKESINNIARHCRCAHVDIALGVQGSQLIMSVSDDGPGFKIGPSDGGQGHGLVSMAERARRLRGHLEITSEIGRGTTVTLTVPFGHHP
jgi:ligand-binding sensor domain-containing protein/signal transduction histidine kinase